ncbi:hypothetical protein FM996_18090 [Methylosinus sporium]|uniref:Uncharacterized protein n=1 Tax=Methylosinus sporium TaxID=428 RepID=A0A549SH88_METSR|nr:hypothetical protein [Methylosinus sporium]TRL28984.1 hypothetical protein FM996_18090 [Methylosinus sporium]
MNKESSASRLHPNASRVSSSLVGFLADALSIAIGAGALGGAVAGIVVLLLDGPSAIRGRTLDAPFIHPASRVSDDLARLFDRSARERSEASESQVADMNLSQHERMSPRSTFLRDE